ncbi:MAG: DNA-directed RNA polymerase subunit omega [Planctomycetota bacterium]
MAQPDKTELGKTLPIRLMEEVQGSYKKTALLQKRVRELVRGQRPLFETRLDNPIEIALEEMRRGLIELVPEEAEEA